MRVRRESRSEVVIGGELVVVEVDLDGRVSVGGAAIGEVEKTGIKVPRTSHWRARSQDGREAHGYTAVDAAVALVYAVSRDSARVRERELERLERARERVANLPRPEDDPPEDVCPFCRATHDACACRPEDFGLDPH